MLDKLDICERINSLDNRFVIIGPSRRDCSSVFSYLKQHSGVLGDETHFLNIKRGSSLQLWKDFSQLAVSNPNKAIGTIVAFSEPFNTPDKEVWRYISEDSSIKVIAVLRDNSLGSILAGRAGCKKIFFNSIHCTNQIQAIDRMVSEIDTQFRAHHVLKIECRPNAKSIGRKLRDFLNLTDVDSNKEIEFNDVPSLEEAYENGAEILQSLKEHNLIDQK